MKKISAIIVALLIVAISAVTAFAAGINDNEQKVLDELKTSVEMQGVEMNWPAAYVNQAENYFNTIDMTSDQAEQIIAVIRSGKTQLESTGAKNIAECTAEQKKAKDGGKSVDVNGKTTDGGVIKITGASADMLSFILIGAAAVSVIAGGVFFAVRKRR